MRRWKWRKKDEIFGQAEQKEEEERENGPLFKLSLQSPRQATIAGERRCGRRACIPARQTTDNIQ